MLQCVFSKHNGVALEISTRDYEEIPQSLNI